MDENFNQFSVFTIVFIIDVKSKVKTLPCLGSVNPETFEFVGIDTSDIGQGGILKQSVGNLEMLVRYTSRTWNTTQLIHNIIKKETLSVVLCISKFQDNLLNQKFLLRVDCKFAKLVLQKDVKNITSKHIFAIYQAILSNFNLQIEYIKGEHSLSPDFLTCEFYRIHETMAPKKNTQAPKLPESQSSKTSKEPSPHKILWSQQVELEEEARLHSSDHMPNKILSLYYDPSNPSKPVKATQYPTITVSQTFKQVTKANPSQNELASNSSFSNKQTVVVVNPTPLSAKSRYWQKDLNQPLLVIEKEFFS